MSCLLLSLQRREKRTRRLPSASDPRHRGKAGAQGGGTQSGRAGGIAPRPPQAAPPRRPRRAAPQSRCDRAQRTEAPETVEAVRGKGPLWDQERPLLPSQPCPPRALSTRARARKKERRAAVARRGGPKRPASAVLVLLWALDSQPWCVAFPRSWKAANGICTTTTARLGKVVGEAPTASLSPPPHSFRRRRRSRSPRRPRPSRPPTPARASARRVMDLGLDLDALDATRAAHAVAVPRGARRAEAPCRIACAPRSDACGV